MKGKIEGPRITFDGRADAYRASATAVGSVTLPADRRPLAFDITGSASHVDLRALPPSARAPTLESNLDVAGYHVRGDGRTISGSATLHRSEIEGATLAEGTSGTFSTDPRTTIVRRTRVGLEPRPPARRACVPDRRLDETRVRRPDQQRLRRDRFGHDRGRPPARCHRDDERVDRA